jgi:hypothetical protein
MSTTEDHTLYSYELATAERIAERQHAIAHRLSARETLEAVHPHGETSADRPIARRIRTRIGDLLVVTGTAIAGEEPLPQHRAERPAA